MGKTNPKGRSRESRHVRIYRYLWPVLLERLDGNAFKALFYMLTFEEGSNNGDIYMGARMLSEGIGVDKKTALRCLQHLDRQGFIRPEQLGYFQQKGGPATRWRFTFLPALGKPPTNEWRQPPAEQKSWGENFPEAGGEIPPMQSAHRTTGGKKGPAEAEIDPTLGGKNGTHTVAIGRAAAGEESEGGFTPQITGGKNSGALDIRNKIAGYFHELSAKRQRAWAEAHGVTRDDIKRYIISDPGHLKPAKLAAMDLAIRNEKAEGR